MNWHADDTWLGEYVDTKQRREGVPADNALSADAVRAADLHLAGCERCRAIVADFQAIRLLSRSLEPHVPPPYVWTKLAASLQEQPKGWRLFSLSTFGLPQAAALAMAAVLATGLWWVGGALTSAPQSNLAADIGAPVMTAGVGSITVQLAEEQFTSAIQGLEQMTITRQDALDPETAGVVQANLSVIDSAIDQSRAALIAEPGNDVAQQSLFQALRSKVALLQNILALINEMRKGDPDAAARIVSGLNQ
jgi:hypothetical protein